MNVDTGQGGSSTVKKVTFAPDSKAPQAESSKTSAVPANQPTQSDEPEPKVDGIIGQLEIHQSGAVKMRLGNGIVLDVRPGEIG
jgi:DNA-directed RNA polymerase III subunit RPC4